jgi:hypothetical protein
MRRQLALMVLAVLLGAEHLDAEGNDAGDAFARKAVKLASLWGYDATQDERTALSKSYEVLSVVDREFKGQNMLLEILQPKDPPVEIAWEEAKRMVEEGKIRSLFQAHSKRVALTATSGKRYTTTEPRIDAILDVVRRVDPKGIFIGIAME